MTIYSICQRIVQNHQLRASESLVQVIQESHTPVVQIPTMSQHITRHLVPSMDIDGGVTAHEMMLGGIRVLTSVQTSTSDSINTILLLEFMRLM